MKIYDHKQSNAKEIEKKMKIVYCEEGGTVLISRFHLNCHYLIFSPPYIIAAKHSK